MDKKTSGPAEDKTADLLLGIGVGFLINLILSPVIPQVGPFIAGLVAGVIVKNGFIRGAAAGFLAGTLGELASIVLWILTNVIAFPGALFPYTAVSAVMALSGGIVGCVVSLQQWPRIHEFLIRHNISLPLLRHSGPVKIQQED